MRKFLEEKGLKLNKPQSCQELWLYMIEAVKDEIRQDLNILLEERPAAGSKADQVKIKFIKKILTETSRATSMTRLFKNEDGSINIDALFNDAQFAAGFSRAVDWVIALPFGLKSGKAVHSLIHTISKVSLGTMQQAWEMCVQLKIRQGILKAPFSDLIIQKPINRKEIL